MNAPISTVCIFIFGTLLGLTCLLSVSHSYAASLTIYELEDIDFGETLPSSTRVRQRSRFCVSMQPRGFYQIRALGSGSAGAFTLSAGAGELNQIPYRVRVRNRELEPGIAATGFRALPARPNGACRQRQRLVVFIDPDELVRAAGGKYQGSLTLTVAPE